jgi:6-phosphofructokinase
MHASFMGYHAVKCIVEDKTNRAVVFRKGEYQNIDLEEAIKCTSEYNSELYDVAKILSI